jgi:hypothetical protein
MLCATGGLRDCFSREIVLVIKPVSFPARCSPVPIIANVSLELLRHFVSQFFGACVVSALDEQKMAKSDSKRCGRLQGVRLERENRIDGPFLSAELSGHAPAGPAWSITPGLVRPQSRGQVRLTGARPTDPVDIDANILSQWVDIRAAMECARLCREVGNAPAFRSLTTSIQSGQTAYAPKIEMGHRLVPLTNYCHHRSILLHAI